MNKGLAFFVLFIVFCGCSVQNQLPTDSRAIEIIPQSSGDIECQNEQYPEIPVKNEPFLGYESVPYLDLDGSQFLGKFVCTGDLFKDEFFAEVPEAVPSITFLKDSECEMVVNYLEGLCTLYGYYTVEQGQILVRVSLEGTIFIEDNYEYIPTEYVFNVVDTENIVIDVEKNFYAVMDGDVFTKTSQ